MRRILYALLTLTLTLSVVSCGGGGGGSSPTAPPPPTLNVDGTWEGIWVPPVTVSATFDQPVGSRMVTGTISALGFTFRIEGETNYAGPGRGTFEWRVVDGGCGSWTGTMQVNGDSMDGPSRLSTLGCSDPDVIRGRMFLSRIAGSSSAPEAAVRGSLERIVRELGESR